MALIQPRTLKGFRDYLPEAMMPREWIIETARRVYRSYGFRPIDTPALEYLEILTGKGSDETDKQLYKFQDHGGRDVGLRFDLTVPLARFVAQHQQELGLPFKRYHIASVWRGENTQTGRYREFMQCDFDTIGVTDLTADIEMTLVINDLFTALGIDKFSIRVNHRAVLNGMLEKLGVADRSAAVLRALDKLAKIGEKGVRVELARTAETTDAQCDQLIAMASLTGDNETILKQLTPLVAGNATGERGVAELRDLVAATAAAGVPAGRIQLDPSIARGLDYYTGVVVETLLEDRREIGSVASGGRYDNLAGLYTNQKLPGVGASLGLDRLLAALQELGRLPSTRTPAPVLICMFDAARRNDYLKLAAQLRAAGIGVELYPEAKKLGKQLQYADKQGFKAAIIIGETEFAAGEAQVKNLQAATGVTLPYNGVDAAPLLAALQPLLAD
ncbi:MAG: histidine--tRNA ligase [Planctomycetaceae bacterium]|nr:histidine--tRNA ligase [Planctomycetaceae bacterium]